MAQRRSKLLPLILAIVGVAVVLFFAWTRIAVPYLEYGRQLDELDGQMLGKLKQLAQVRKEQAAMERFEALSLPTNLGHAQLEYERYLLQLLTRHGFNNPSLRPGSVSPVNLPAAKNSYGSAKKDERIYTALDYKIDAVVSLSHLTAMLKEFGEAPLLQRIKTMTLRPADGEAKKVPKKRGDYQLMVQMDVEAIVVDGASQRPQTLIGPDERLVELGSLTNLFRGPGAIALVPWVVGPAGPMAQKLAVKARGYHDYGAIERDNIFIGYVKPEPPPVKIKPPEPKKDPEPEDDLDLREWYKLIMISKTPERDEAWLFCVANNHFVRLRTSPGFNYFAIKNQSGEKTLLKGKVLKIDYGTVYFQEGTRVYAIQRGETIQQATRKSVPDGELIKAGLKVVKGP